MVAKDILPLSVVRGAGFQLFCSLLNPAFKVPTVPVVRNHLRKIYLELLPEIKARLANEYVALTTDLWTSIAHKPFIGITAHYITVEWKYENVLLACRLFDDRHTGM